MLDPNLADLSYLLSYDLRKSTIMAQEMSLVILVKRSTFSNLWSTKLLLARRYPNLL